MKHFGKGHKARFDTTTKFWKKVDLMLTEAIAVQPGWTNSLKQHLLTYRDTSSLVTPASPVQKSSRHSAMPLAGGRSNPTSGFDITTDEIEAPAPPPDQDDDDTQSILKAEAESSAAAEIQEASQSLSMFQRVMHLRSAQTSYSADDSSGNVSLIQQWREPVSLEDIIYHHVYAGFFYAFLTEASLDETLEFVLAIKLAKQVIYMDKDYT
jgi:hypothetical protein